MSVVAKKGIKIVGYRPSPIPPETLRVGEKNYHSMTGERVLYESPNGKWSITIPYDKMFWTGYRVGNRVAEVCVSDGYVCYYVGVWKEYGNRGGVIVEDEMFEYRVPKYVRDKAYNILKQIYKQYKAGNRL